MSRGMFVPPWNPENSNCARRALLVLFIFLVLGLPVSVFAKGLAGSDVNLEVCIQSFARQLEDSSWRGQASRRSPAPPPVAADSSAHEDCVEFLVQMLANYDEQYQLQRGKPPPPPPPPSSEPAKRGWHAFSGNGSTVADASRLYLFAGSGADLQPVPGDLWYYRVDLADWILAPTGTTRPGRRQHVGFSCGAGQCVTSNGNNGVGSLKETWIYTEGTSSWSQINCKRNLCPSARHMLTMAYDPARSYHLLFGGESTTYYASLDDTYTFKGGRWTARNPAHKPGARHWAATAFAKAPVNKVVLFGGLDGYTSVHCDMYAWTDTDWQQVAMTNTGPCLYAHSMAWDEAGKRLMVTGGYLGDRTDTPNPDVWYFTFSTDGGSGTWSKEPAGSVLATCAASAKPGARMAYDVPSGDKVFFGGEENTDSGAVRYDSTVVCH